MKVAHAAAGARVWVDSKWAPQKPTLVQWAMLLKWCQAPMRLQGPAVRTQAAEAGLGKQACPPC